MVVKLLLIDIDIDMLLLFCSSSMCRYILLDPAIGTIILLWILLAPLTLPHCCDGCSA